MIDGGSAGMSSPGGALCPQCGGWDPCELMAYSHWEAPIQPIALCCH